MAAVYTNNLEVTDETGTRYIFGLVNGQNGATGVELRTRAWETQDSALTGMRSPMHVWRQQLHPWSGGLGLDRLNNRPVTYAKGNADTSYGELLPPPLINAVTVTNGTAPSQLIEFNSLVFILGGRYMYYYDPAAGTVTQDKDFGVGKAAVTMAVFNGELIVGMGETEKVWKRTTGAAWAQATDATYAIALGVVDNKLWRAETTNRISVVVTTPLTLANWLPASPNQYYCGDSTWAVHTIIDYGGIPWCMKGDGAYAPDPQTRFKNQVPQMRRTPHANNGKGAFTAQGFLWVPSSSGLFRVRPGESKKRGPEVSQRPDYRFWVRGGVEINEAIYLLVNDEAASSNTAIIKMVRDTTGMTGRDYIYYEWCSLGATTVGYSITASTVGTNPQVIAGFGNDIRWVKLGRGGGRDIDDTNYAFGTATSLETGLNMPDNDLTILTTLVGVDVMLDFSRAGESLTIAAAMDRLTTGGTYTNLLSTQEGGGAENITMTAGYERITRYAPPNTQGQFLEVKFTGALTSASGLTRPSIKEAWAFGYSHPRRTDELTIHVNASSDVQVSGRRSGRSRRTTLQLWRGWQQRGIVLTIKLQDYEQGRTTRVLVRGVDEASISETVGKNRTNSNVFSSLQVTLLRVDYANAYATAVS